MVLLPVLLLFGDWDIKFHDGNNIKCWISNFEEVAQQEGDRPGLEWPITSGHFYGFGAGNWYGALLAPDDTCVSMGYYPFSGRGEFVPGLVRQGTTAYHNPYVRVYLFPEDWPPDPDTFPMAPQVPLTDEDSWACFNECDSAYHDSNDTHPIGLEIYRTGYADAECPDAIFFRYTIKNCTTYTITNAYVGIAFDYDVGDHWDDMYGLIYKRWFPSGSDSFYIDALPYGYDHDWHEPGWDTVGVIGFYMLETPGDNGPTSCMLFTLELDPAWDYERYQMLKGIDFNSGESIGFILVDTLGPGEKVILFSTGPFDLAPGETTHFAYEIVLALDTISIAYVANEARLFYWENILVEEDVPKQINRGIRIYPNPTYGPIMLDLPRYGEDILLYDISGRLIRTLKSSKRINLPLTPGVYFLTVKVGDRTRCEKIVILR
jgi:hypothetical protein